MPAPDVVLLPICVAIALLGVIFAGLAWRRGSKGRVLQWAAVAIVPFGLYLTGFLSLLWNAVVALVRWSVRLVFSPTLWIGVSIVGFCVLLFIVGSIVARLSGESKPRDKKQKKTAGKSGPPQVGGGSDRGKKKAEADPEMDEIEALLKSRGID
jgi:hypothetical protein